MQNRKLKQTPKLTYQLSGPLAYAGGNNLQQPQETNNVI